ncbi:hypothetical protein VWT76_15850 [Xanthomonas citri pv. citri]|uniref:hypothetical protein n=1 Tax=Xanthomonas TaxID=338 RepID=UPI000ADFEDA5|nr:MULTISPECIES: hypothetical protein [Xanthomonas]MBD5034970.1 hypothetical protein [Xanthomonas citri pv. citri]MBD5054746.1 hypothetical protein [Xanthomonas citri pv. citri]MCC8630248.1 hypothetical protein [Xanthomonas vesicatoria]
MIDISTAFSQPPVRIELGNEVYWLRPTDVTRIETLVSGESPDYVNIWLSDGSKVWLSCVGMKLAEAHSIADGVALKLWPVQAPSQEAPKGWTAVEA